MTSDMIPSREWSAHAIGRRVAFPPHVARLSPPFLVFRSDGGCTMRKVNPSQEYFKSVLHYDHETGLLYHRKRFEAGIVKPIGRRLTQKDSGRLVITLRIGGIDSNFYVHRVAWIMVNGQIPEGLQIDHINSVASDNRIDNLRCVTQIVNIQNIRRPLSTSRSGLLGVFPRKNGRWGAKISVNSKNIALGSYSTKEEAHQAYVAKKREIHEGCTI